jgi:radical SAM superfamily enzyme YgiQ (UPF0313 family)
MPPKKDIILVDPLFNLQEDKMNITAIAFLKGHLKSKGFNVDVLNFNKLIPKTKKQEMLKEITNQNLNFFNYKNAELFYYKHAPQYLHSLYLKLLSTSKWEELEEFKLFKKMFDQISLKDLEYKYIGITVTLFNHFIFTIFFATYIKLNLNKDIKIIVGGDTISKKYDEIINILKVNPVMDYLVVGEGETPLEVILKEEEERNIPNLIHYNNGIYVFSENMTHVENINNLASPEYEIEDGLYRQGIYTNK